MPNLKCSVSPCTYWSNDYCTRSGIQVKGNSALVDYETKCSSYKLRNRTSSDDSYNTEIASLGFGERMLSVNCDAANCDYNRNLKCKAKYLKINGTRAQSDESTFCSTFELK